MIRSSKIVVALSALLLVPMGTAMGGRPDPGVPEHGGTGTPGVESAGGIEHVANIGGFNASDIEFASREVVKLSDGATGDPVCEPDETEFDGCARDEQGEIIYQRETRDFAVVGGYGPDTRIIDITNPRAPVLVKVGPCRASQGDIQIQGDLLFIAQDGGSASCPGQSPSNFNGTGVLDFSDPRNPTMISRLQYARGSHNQTVHPTKPFVYLSDSDVASTGLGNVPVWDVSDPANPKLATEFKFGAHSPHDITFNADGSRAYAAAVSLTYILNTEDPANPTLVSVIPNEGISISHQADPTPDGKYLLVTDELGGGAAGVSPGGPVHMYDIRDETRPVKLGAIWDDCVGNPSVNCDSSPASNPAVVPISTAHVLRINPDGYTMAMGWYKDGIHVIDFSGIQSAAAIAGSGGVTNMGARTIARMKMPNANNWAAKMWQERHPGYVFSTDHGGRGFDVFYVAELGETERGTFMASGRLAASHPGTSEAGAGVTRLDWETNCEYSPRMNGIDGWVTKIPAELADGSHELTATDANGSLEYDLDMFFYDGDCNLVKEVTEIGTSETGGIPAGAKYVLATSWFGAPQAQSIYFYAKKAA